MPLLPPHPRQLQLAEAPTSTLRGAHDASAATEVGVLEHPIPLEQPHMPLYPTQSIASPSSSAQQPIPQEPDSPGSHSSSALTPISAHSDELREHAEEKEATIEEDDILLFEPKLNFAPDPVSPAVSLDSFHPPSPRKSVIWLPGQNQVPLRLNDRQWLSEPKPIQWSPGIEREGIEPNDRLDQLRPLDDALTSLVPGLGAVPAPPERLLPSAPLGTARPLPWPQRRYVAEMVRKSSRVPSGARKALAEFVETDQWRPPSEKHILLAKPVWVIPFESALPVAVTDRDTDTTSAQIEHSVLVLVVEPKLPQCILLTLPNHVAELLSRSATYNSHIDSLGNVISEQDTEAKGATVISSSCPGSGVGGSICPVVPINVELDPTLGLPRSTEDTNEEQQALLSAEALSRRIDVPVPPSAFGVSWNGGEPRNSGGPSHRLRTGPFILPGEKERWWARVLQKQTSNVTMTAQMQSVSAQNGRARKQKMIAVGNEELSRSNNLGQQLKRMYRELGRLQVTSGNVQDDLDESCRLLAEEQKRFEEQLGLIRAQQAAARDRAKARTDYLRRILSELRQAELTTEQENKSVARRQQVVHISSRPRRNQDEEMADELKELAEEAADYI